MAKISVKGREIVIFNKDDEDYICITDIARYKNSDRTDDLVRNWLRNRNTIEFLGIWEQLNNPDFKPVEFDGFRKQAGLNSFTLTPSQWIEKTNAIGIISKQGRYGGTYAHKDIAFEFASWISVEFKLYLIKEFQRLKEDEQKKLGWDIRRNLAKINYRIHTDAIKENLIPPELTPHQISLVYANEAADGRWQSEAAWRGKQMMPDDFKYDVFRSHGAKDESLYRLVCGILGRAPGDAPMKRFGVREVAAWQGAGF